MPASRHVGDDQRPRARGRLQQRARHALAAARRQHEDVGAPPYLADVLHMAGPARVVLGAPRHQSSAVSASGCPYRPAVQLEPQGTPRFRAARRPASARRRPWAGSCARRTPPRARRCAAAAWRGTHRSRRRPRPGSQARRVDPPARSSARSSGFSTSRKERRLAQHRGHQAQRTGAVEPQRWPVRKPSAPSPVMCTTTWGADQLEGKATEHRGLHGHQMHHLGSSASRIRASARADLACRTGLLEERR